jgi:hypothetical protein
MCGYFAAQAVLRRVRVSDGPRLVSRRVADR